MSVDFVRETARNQIAGRLQDAFFAYYRHRPGPAEVNSWRNSLRAMKDIVELAGLHDHGVLLEYQLPLSSKRIDCLICGRDSGEADEAVIVELKQWEQVESAEPENLVRTWVGGRHREILDPSVQVGQYRQYLEDSHTAFYEEPNAIRLSSCSYLHNYYLAPNDAILDPKFSKALNENPVFDADAADRLGEFLKGRLGLGNGREVLTRIEESRYRPSRKLMDYVATTIRSRAPWVLLDEQLVVFERFRATTKSGLFGRKKQVIIVRGGPGTGKSVLAINLVADLLREGHNAHYATGSKAFTETLWSILGSRSKATFKYFNSYGEAERDELDVLICDESHRIRETSNNRFTKKEKRSSRPQVNEILEAAKVAVFFIDEQQVVRQNEIGSTAHIREHAHSIGAELSEYDLEVQFRCAGSDGFVNWIDNTLGLRRTANVIWDGSDGFDFRIVDDPQQLDALIREKTSEGHTARVAAGYCWKWSHPDSKGQLVNDVMIEAFARPWNARPDSGKLASGIPPASLWATDPGGIEQVGCVYTVQGFELDYIGVIWGRDLKYDLDRQEWLGDKTQSQDPTVKRSKEKFLDLVRHTYRVLLSRGMKGCFVHFMDRDTERFIRSRIETQFESPSLIREGMPTILQRVRPLSVRPRESEKYVHTVPIVPLKIAAGAFGDPQAIDERALDWAEVDTTHRLRLGMFVAQVIGKSMEPSIPDGAWCLFASPVVGSRQGKTVLVQFRDSIDPETGERYTVKRYYSEKRDEGESWEHDRIILRPMNPDFEPIVLSGAREGQLQVIAELIEVLG